ncbi:MAG TPA: GNAT family N-acetyltransferase [Gaiellaceae bacterium]|nr:GNAT family N-acetyltransferase [Gaiellaceae bacterium]
MSEAARIQAYLRATARGFYDAVAVPPFTAFFHPDDRLRYLNYAIPDEPVAGEPLAPDLGEPLAWLRGAFRSRDRLLRFEYVEGFAPGLAASLEQAGFELELRAPLMTCRTTDLVDPPRPARLEIVPAAHDPRAQITIGRRAFGSGDEPEANDEDVEAWLKRSRSAALLGLLDGEPVAIASATPPLDGLSEVAGVAVLAHARNLGIGAAMTAAAGRAAAENGAALVFLSPGSDGARSVYERVGFRPAEVSLFYFDPE